MRISKAVNLALHNHHPVKAIVEAALQTVVAHLHQAKAKHQTIVACQSLAAQRKKITIQERKHQQ